MIAAEFTQSLTEAAKPARTLMREQKSIPARRAEPGVRDHVRDEIRGPF